MYYGNIEERAGKFLMENSLVLNDNLNKIIYSLNFSKNEINFIKEKKHSILEIFKFKYQKYILKQEYNNIYPTINLNNLNIEKIMILEYILLSRKKGLKNTNKKVKKINYIYSLKIINNNLLIEMLLMLLSTIPVLLMISYSLMVEENNTFGITMTGITSATLIILFSYSVWKYKDSKYKKQIKQIFEFLR